MVEFEEERQFKIGVRLNQQKTIEMGIKKENVLNEIVKRQVISNYLSLYSLILDFEESNAKESKKEYEMLTEYDFGEGCQIELSILS